MEIVGKIILALPEVSGTSKAGNPWKKRDYVLETQESYPKKIAFDFFGERADQYPLSVGDLVRLNFDIESREFNGRWYTSIRGWKAEKVDPAAMQASQMAGVAGQAFPDPLAAPAAPAYGGAPAYGQPAPAPAPYGAAPAAPGMANDDLPF